MTLRRLSITEVNAMQNAAFVTRFGSVYERSAWVAQGAWQARPFADCAALERAMQEVVRGATRASQLELLRMHPRLGTRQELSGYSRSEQAGAGLLAAGAADLEQLEQLNRTYEQKFGFPFILAVRNASVRQILDSCRMRVNHDEASEFEESLRQVFTIARFRLSDLLENGLPA